MKKLNQISIGKRISYGFVIVMIVIFLCNCFTSVGIGGISAIFKMFYKTTYTNSVAAMGVRNTLNVLEKKTTEYIYDNTPSDETLKEYNENLESLNFLLELLDESFVSDKDNLQQIHNLLPQSLKIQEELVAIPTPGDILSAEAKLENEYRPIMAEIRSLADEIFEISQQNAESYYNESVNSIRLIFIVLVITTIINILAVVVVSRVLRNTIVPPVKKVEKAAIDLSKGRLDTYVDYKGDDEVATLANSMNSTVKTLQLYIGDITKQLRFIAAGDLSQRSDIEYIGDFSPIRASLDDIKNQLNQTLWGINLASEEVSGGAKDIANAATALAKSTTEQAGIVEQFIATIAEVSNHIGDIAQVVDSVSIASRETKNSADVGMETMQKMLISMDEINTASEKIANIIKIVDEIAAQTNLLALNAAIEAARAGEAGKGFAVVATEIRDLATRSSEIVKEIESIIKESIKSVNNGQKMATDASNSLGNIKSSIDRTASIAEGLLENSTKQKQAMEEFSKGTKYIAQVIESNSETAEESASVSEELAAQAQSLKHMIEYFKITR